MQKIDFVNSQQPAINDTNLNLMQTYIETAIQGAVSGDTLPVGAMVPFPGGTVPDNYLLCNGQAVSRTTYAQLFSIIGTAYGVGDGSTTFNVPDMRGRTPVGYDSTQTEFNALGKTGGTKTHSHIYGIQLGFFYGGAAGEGSSAAGVLNNGNGSAAGFSASTGATMKKNAGYQQSSNETSLTTQKSTAHTSTSSNLQPYNTANFIIKAFQSAGVVAQVVNQYSTSTTDVYSCNYINTRIDVSSLITKSSKVGTVYLKQAYKKGNRVYFSAQFEILQEGAELFTIDSSLKPIYAEVGNGTNYQSGSSVPMIIKVSANGSSIDSNVYASSVLSYAAIHIEWEV